MDTRPDENGMAPRRRQHFRILGLFVIPPNGGLKTTSTAGHKCCAVFVLGRRPPWLLVQLELGVTPAHCSAEDHVHLDELEPRPSASAAVKRSSHGRVVFIVVGLISNGHGELPASAPLTPLWRGWQPHQCGRWRPHTAPVGRHGGGR
jgi:hypothetical protein